MNPRYAALMAVFLVAGCVEIAPPPEVAGGGPATGLPSEYVDGVNMFSIGMPETYAVLTAERNTVTLLLKTWISVSQPIAYVRVVDRDGAMKDTILEPALPPNEVTPISLDLRDVTFPAVLVAECACHVWVHDEDGRGESIRPGASAYVEQRWINATLGYEATRPEEVTGNPILADSATLVMPSNVIHWQLQYGFNLRGEAELLTPQEDQLVYLRTEGRDVVEGHLSMGYTPLLPGNWSARLSGHGWFQFALDTYVLSNEGWQMAGVKPPA